MNKLEGIVLNSEKLPRKDCYSKIMKAFKSGDTVIAANWNDGHLHVKNAWFVNSDNFLMGMNLSKSTANKIVLDPEAMAVFTPEIVKNFILEWFSNMNSNFIYHGNEIKNAEVDWQNASYDLAKNEMKDKAIMMFN